MPELVKQYHNIKSKYPNHIILFNNGFGYKSIFDSATIISKALNIPLIDNSISFEPYLLDEYLTKLIKYGYRVAIKQT